MQLNRYTFSAVLFFILCQITVPSFGQLGISFDIKKPEEYDDRVLGSEKTDQKKFTLPRRFIQNSFTHYNYFFNANNKLNEIIEQAKTRHRDDFNELLSFYNYSLDVTAQDKVRLDSVIYKSTTGIVLHDLRNDWIDNMYLLMGAAYYLRKEFDSAYLTFQFINYAFAEKEKDGYYRNIGSNLDGNNAFSISTKEKNSLPRKLFSDPPSRNDAFIWQIRSLIAREEYAESASLIVTLRNDPLFPKRLQNDLDEVQAWWFYNNNMFDSAAHYLSRALNSAPTKNEKARWEFLTAQLYELSEKPELAKSWYEKVIGHTIDPVMEIYARLHSIRINKEGGENYIDRNIAELLKMAKRDKYVDYKDVIYYTVAQMELERNNFEAAQLYLTKSASFNTGNVELRNKAYLQMAELAYAQKKYRLAYNFYDSLRLNDPLLKNIEKITERKQMLGKIATQIEIIERQDSLQRIAAMTKDEREEYVRKLVKHLRKQQGLKDEVPVSSFPNPSTPAPADIFTSTAAKAEWYFYNTALRTKGASEFKAKWGNRPNVDNWRRSSAANLFTQNNRSLTGRDAASQASANQPGEITFEALYNNLPLDEKQMAISNDSIQKAMHTLGKSLADDVEDCSSSIVTLEELRTRFPKYDKMDEVLFTLYYCYNKTGETAKAEQLKKLMSETYPGNPLTAIVSTGKDPRKQNANADATRTYEHIYDLFIEGAFAEAIEEKKKADSIYGSHYWTPQLLYIEAVYYIRQREDSIALKSLLQITEKHSGTPLASKASNLINVLGRRQQIEDELRNLEVSRPIEEPVKQIIDTVTVVQKPKPEVVPPVVKAPDVTRPVTDTVSAKPLSFNYKAEDKHFVALFLHKTDPVWVSEAKNAFNRYNRERFYNKTFEISVADISGEYRVILIGGFDNAQAAADYVQAARPRAPLEIIPWLKGDKYTFSVITASNLEVLKTQKDVTAYKQFLETHLPGKF